MTQEKPDPQLKRCAKQIFVDLFSRILSAHVVQYMLARKIPVVVGVSLTGFLLLVLDTLRLEILLPTYKILFVFALGFLLRFLPSYIKKLIGPIPLKSNLFLCVGYKWKVLQYKPVVIIEEIPYCNIHGPKFIHTIVSVTSDTSIQYFCFACSSDPKTVFLSADKICMLHQTATNTLQAIIDNHLNLTQPNNSHE